MKVLGMSLLVLMVLSLMTGVCYGQTAEGYLDKGIAYYRKGMLDKAIAEFKKALEINPKLAEAHGNLGVAYYRKGMLDKAIAECKKALEINPKLAEAHNNLGVGKLPDWTDRSEADLGIVLIEVFAHVADILSYYQDRIANESFLATAQERRSVIHHLRLIGYELAPAAAASAMLSLIVSNEQDITITITKGNQFSTKSTETEKGVTFEYVGDDLEINLGTLEKDSAGAGFKKYVGIPVEEGETVADEILGISNGTANQSFKLSQPKMIRNSLKLQVELSESSIECWELKSSLIFSRHDDKHYFIRTDENDFTAVYFGDGLYGKIPEKGAKIIATYRVGGGLVGNVRANKITEIKDAPSLQTVLAQVTNETAASGGENRESIEHAIKFAPKVLRSFDRPVTQKDFVNHH